MFCPHCGKEITEGQPFCQYCGSRVEASSADQAGLKTTPWEDRAALGFFGGLTRTLKNSLFSPREFFRKMSVSGGLTDPLLYALIVVMAGMIVSYLWQVLLQGAMQSLLPAEMRSAAGYDLFQGVGLVVLAVMLPFAVIAFLFIEAGILHLLLMLVRGANRGFEATFRVAAYSSSAQIFMALPFCGGLVAWIWSVVLAIIGLTEAHQTSGGKASFAVLFPLVFCCGLMLAAVALGLFAAFTGLRH